MANVACGSFSRIATSFAELCPLPWLLWDTSSIVDILSENICSILNYHYQIVLYCNWIKMELLNNYQEYSDILCRHISHDLGVSEDGSCLDILGQFSIPHYHSGYSNTGFFLNLVDYQLHQLHVIQQLD